MIIRLSLQCYREAEFATNICSNAVCAVCTGPPGRQDCQAPPSPCREACPHPPRRWGFRFPLARLVVPHVHRFPQRHRMLLRLLPDKR
jgi:hypothetical protein